MPGARCIRSLVYSVLVAHECRHHGRAGITGHSRTQWFYGCFMLPGDRTFLSPSLAKVAFRAAHQKCCCASCSAGTLWNDDS
jgi:hypothetical protein